MPVSYLSSIRGSYYKVSVFLSVTFLMHKVISVTVWKQFFGAVVITFTISKQNSPTHITSYSKNQLLRIIHAWIHKKLPGGPDNVFHLFWLLAFY